MHVYLVSGCLLGLRTRYDGKIMPDTAYGRLEPDGLYIPVCPEQLGGLPTPRTAADLVEGDGYDVLAGRARVVTRSGDDVTHNFILGARQVLEIARQQDITRVFFKGRSPSCGLTPRIGVTAALLRMEGFTVEEIG